MPSCSGLGGEKHEKVSSIYVVIAMTLEGIEVSAGPTIWGHAAHTLYKVCLQSGRRGDVQSFAQRGYLSVILVIRSLLVICLPIRGSTITKILTPSLNHTPNSAKT